VIQNNIKEFIGKKCYETFAKLQIDPECSKLLLSKTIGVAIVAGGAFAKVPQIANIVNSSSAQGVSLSSYGMETAAYCINLAYNYRHRNPFNTYGETFFLTLQNFIVIYLILKYNKQNMLALVIAFLAAAFNLALHSNEYVNNSKMIMLQAITIPLCLVSKVPQIYQNYKNCSTGTLSAITVFSYFLGSLARIYTTQQEVNDPLIMWGFIRKR